MNNDNAKRFLFDNGIVLILESVPHANSIILGFASRVGSKNDPPNKSGIAHLCEHLLVGACNRRLPEHVLNELDIDAFTEREEIYIKIRTPYDGMAHLIDWLNILIEYPEISEQDLEMEKKIVSQEIVGIANSEIEKIDNFFFDQAFKNSRLVNPIAGTLEDVQGITLDDVRIFCETLLHPSNLIISMTGCLSLNSTYDRIAAKISAYNHNGGSPVKKDEKSIFFSPGRFMIPSELDLIYFIYGFPTEERTNSDRIGVYALSKYIGEGSTSLLSRKIRSESGLLYSIASEYHLFKQIGVIMFKGVTTEPNFLNVIEIIDGILNRIVNVPFQETQVGLIKAGLRKSYLINMDDLNNRILRLLKHEAWFSQFFTTFDDLEFIESLNTENLGGVAKSIFSRRSLLCHGEI